jgi:hypothetical protein
MVSPPPEHAMKYSSQQHLKAAAMVKDPDLKMALLVCARLAKQSEDAAKFSAEQHLKAAAWVTDPAMKQALAAAARNVRKTTPPEAEAQEPAVGLLQEFPTARGVGQR